MQAEMNPVQSQQSTCEVRVAQAMHLDSVRLQGDINESRRVQLQDEGKLKWMPKRTTVSGIRY